MELPQDINENRNGRVNLFQDGILTFRDDLTSDPISPTTFFPGRRGGLICLVSALVSGSSGPGSSPDQGHCVVFLGRKR